jgi:putative FmdB family regulatory protein
MPTYEYACKNCGEHLEVVQSFKDDALTTCPQCGGDLRKVFGSIGIAFKGSGFYKTDSRPAAASSSSSSSSDKTEKKAEPAKAESASTKPDTKADSKPAKSEAKSASA